MTDASEQEMTLVRNMLDLNMLSWCNVNVNQTNACSRGLWEKCHNLLIYFIFRAIHKFNL